MKHTQKDYEKIIVIQEKVIKSLDATIKAKQEESNTLKKIIEKGWDRTDNYSNWIGYLKHLNQSYYAGYMFLKQNLDPKGTKCKKLLTKLKQQHEERKKKDEKKRKKKTKGRTKRL